MFINYGLGGAGNFSARPAQKFLTPPRQALKNFRPPLSRGQKIYDPPLSIHVNVLYMSLTNNNLDSCLCLIYEFDKWQFHWSTWVYTKTYKASRCKFYEWRKAPKMNKSVNWFHFRSFQKFANTFHQYSMLFMYKQSYRFMRQSRSRPMVGLLF